MLQSIHASCDLERVEKRALSIICPSLSYRDAIELMDIVPIGDYISSICSNTFESIVKDPDHRLHSLVPFSGPSSYALRCNRRFVPPKFKTDRFKNSFIIRSCLNNIYK
jgi:hypothetical protein